MKKVQTDTSNNFNIENIVFYKEIAYYNVILYVIPIHFNSETAGNDLHWFICPRCLSGVTLPKLLRLNQSSILIFVYAIQLVIPMGYIYIEVILHFISAFCLKCYNCLSRDDGDCAKNPKKPQFEVQCSEQSDLYRIQLNASRLSTVSGIKHNFRTIYIMIFNDLHFLNPLLLIILSIPYE